MIVLAWILTLLLAYWLGRDHGFDDGMFAEKMWGDEHRSKFK